MIENYIFLSKIIECNKDQFDSHNLLRDKRSIDLNTIYYLRILKNQENPIKFAVLTKLYLN